MTDRFIEHINSLSLSEMAAEAGKRTGKCHSCHTHLLPGEDFIFCDKCWDNLFGKEV